MDDSVRQQETDEQQPSRFLTSSLHIFNGILQTLTGFLQLTEEERKDAGIYYPGEQPDE